MFEVIFLLRTENFLLTFLNVRSSNYSEVKLLDIFKIEAILKIESNLY